ncbi:MAG: hypothetical protein JWM32_3127 [Verrucomicrobia bacterium]|nr:hypothetical protein [Verrucomicrobiota bacterium]
MHQLNEIEGKDLARLTPVDLAKLLRILLYAEAQVRDVAASGIHVPSVITVADGGEDGRWKTPLMTSDYIPNEFTVYQVKAQELGKAECAAEVVMVEKKGKKTTGKKAKKLKSAAPRVKAMVKEVLDANGCYCFFCSHCYGAQKIEERLAAARAALVAAGYKNAQLAFLDGDKISAWANRHSSARAYVTATLKLAPDTAMRTWPQWSTDKAFADYPYATNPVLEQHRDTLRDVLQKPRQTVRVFGPSGLGKTRLVLEALKPDQRTTGHSLSDLVVYFDLEEQAGEKMEAIRQIADLGLSGIVVADNCSPAHHALLKRSTEAVQSRVSLITIDFEEQKLPSDNFAIELKPESSVDIVEKILRGVTAFQTLTDAEVRAIAAFSEGFPIIAVWMAQQKAAPSLDQLNEGKFVEKLLWGRKPPDKPALAILEALAVFSHVGVAGDVAGQVSFVREKICELPSDAVLRQRVVELVRRRIIQPVGNYWIVAPRPIAVALAANWWEAATQELMTTLLPDLERQKLVGALCDRLRLLSFSNRLNKLTTELCGPNGPFMQAELMFTPAGSQLFRALSEINPESALGALHRLVSPRSMPSLNEIAGKTRRNLVTALEKLCWPAHLFERAATLLLKFAAAENETWSNNATGQFIQLYQPFLSGTQRPALERLNVLEAALGSSEEAVRLIAVSAMGTALQGGSFTRGGGVEIRGTQLPEKDWEPKTWQDLWDFQVAVFERLMKVAEEDGTVGSTARKTAGQRLRTLLHAPTLDRITPLVVGFAKVRGNFWPEARTAIEIALEHDAPKQSSEVRGKLEALRQLLVPQDLALQLKQTVTVAGFRHRKNEQGDFIDTAGIEARTLGEELGASWQQMPNAGELLTGNQDKAYEFGAGLAKTVPNGLDFADWALKELRVVTAEKRNATLLMGFLSQSDPKVIAHTLDAVAKDDALNTLYLQLARSRPLTGGDINTVAQLVGEGRLPPQTLAELSYAPIDGIMAASALIDLLMPIARKNSAAVAPVYLVLSRFAEKDPTKWKATRAAIRELMMDPAFVANAHDQEGLFWEKQVNRLFGNGKKDEALAVSLARQIVAAEENEDTGISFDNTRKRILAVLLGTHGDKVWPVVGSGLLGQHSFRVALLLAADSGFDATGRNLERFYSPFWNVPEATALAWFRAHPDALSTLFRNTALVTTTDQGEFEWHPLILTLMRELAREEHVGEIGANLWSFSSNGSRVPYTRRRIAVLKKLEQEKNPALSAFALSWITHFESDLVGQEKEDAEQRAGIY